MSDPIVRIRRRIREMASLRESDRDAVIEVIDEEVEREAQRKFTQAINPDPVTRMAKEAKK